MNLRHRLNRVEKQATNLPDGCSACRNRCPVKVIRQGEEPPVEYCQRCGRKISIGKLIILAPASADRYSPIIVDDLL